MNINIDTVLLFVAGMILGGYVYTRAETYAMKRYFPLAEGEERLYALKKIGFRLTFIGVFLFVLVFFLMKSAILAGVCAGFAIFGIKL